MSTDDLLTDARQLLKQGATEAAARACQQALRAEPDSIPAITLMAKIARAADEPVAAERLVHHALRESVGLGDGELWFQLALALVAQHRLHEAAQAYYQVVLADPQAVATWINLTALNVDLDLWRQGEYCARRALECDPKSTPALINLGEVLRGRSKIEGTIACLEQALRINPESPLAHWNFALALLARGDFERGWQHYEWRERANQVSIDPYPQPRWNGEPLAGRRLLVHAEQGLGDEILFASCYDDLLRLGGHCVLVCDPRLAAAAAAIVSSRYGALVFSGAKTGSRPNSDKPVDWQIPAGSLPKMFRRRAEDFPDSAAVSRRRSGVGPAVARTIRNVGPLAQSRNLVASRRASDRAAQTHHPVWINGNPCLPRRGFPGSICNTATPARTGLGPKAHWESRSTIGPKAIRWSTSIRFRREWRRSIWSSASTTRRLTWEAHWESKLGFSCRWCPTGVGDWKAKPRCGIPALRLVRQTVAGAWEPLFLAIGRRASRPRRRCQRPAEPGRVSGRS